MSSCVIQNNGLCHINELIVYSTTEKTQPFEQLKHMKKFLYRGKTLAYEQFKHIRRCVWQIVCESNKKQVATHRQI